MNRPKTASWARLFAGTAALSLALTACGSDDSGNDDGGNNESGENSSENFPDAACDDSATSADSFKVGGILPLTGTLAFLGPPEIAGVGLAVNDINAAGAPNDAEACHQILDSGDTADLSVSTGTAQTLISGKPSVVVGAASSSVTENVYKAFQNAKITEISPANTAVSLSGVSPFYFRTAPPDTVQGNALGTLISQDGYQKVAFLVFNDTYGTGLRDVVQETVEASGGEVTYGGKGKGEEFPPKQSQFQTEVDQALATNPDAIVVLAFDETKSIVPTLADAGWDMSKTYFTDGNLSDYSADFSEGLLEGAQGTLPGNDPDGEFKERASAWFDSTEGEPLKDYSYSAESYDATILAALAAARGGANDSATVQKNMLKVAGGTDGAECTSYEECLKIVEGGEDVTYQGPSGIGPLNDKNDPSSAFIGIYAYGADNTYELSTTVEGTS